MMAGEREREIEREREGESERKRHRQLRLKVTFEKLNCLSCSRADKRSERERAKEREINDTFH